MKAILIPFGYNSYPEEVMFGRIEDGKKHLQQMGVDFVATDAVIEVKDVLTVREQMKNEQFDYIICMIATWIEATNVMEVCDTYKHLPMLLWCHENISTGTELLSLGAVASYGVMREAFEQFEYTFTPVVGNPFDEKIEKPIQTFHAAMRAVSKLKTARIGLVGYASMGMYTAMADHINLKKFFGTEIFQIDQYSLIKESAFDDITDKQVEDVLDDLNANWTVCSNVKKEQLEKTAKIYLRLKELMEQNLLNAATIKCQYEMSLEYNFSPCVALSLLGMEYPVCCEGDVHELISQLILSEVSGGKVTAYGDVLHFLDDGIICAACGFAPKVFLSGEKPVIDCHTAIITGLLITSPFKEQKVTMIRVSRDKAGYKLHLIKGRTEELKDFHEIGCPAYSGSVIKFENKTVEDFKKEIMSQHYAIVTGDYEAEIRQYCEIMNIRIV